MKRKPKVIMTVVQGVIKKGAGIKEIGLRLRHNVPLGTFDAKLEDAARRAGVRLINSESMKGIT